MLLVSTWYPPIRSGSSLWAESIVQALRKRGHDVRVVTTHWNGKQEEPPGTCDEALYRLPAWLVPRNRFLLGLSNVPVAWSFANRRRMLEIVHEFKPDVIHQMNHIFDTVLLSAFAARRTRTPLVGYITTPIQSRSRVRQALMRAVDLAVVYRFGVRHWDRIVAFDSPQARYVIDTYGRRVDGRVVTDIHMGINERFSTSQLEPKTPWPQIVMVGHLHEIRDPTNLIRAMPAVLQRFPDAKFDIAGRVQFTGPVEEVKRLGLEGAVRFLGEVPVESVAAIVSRAHVFAILHQCSYAGLSSTAMEAMHVGTPVVINAPEDTFGPGVMRDGEHVLLVDGDDVGQIAARIIALLGDKELRERIGRGGQQFAAAHLSWDVCAEKIEALCKELVRST